LLSPGVRGSIQNRERVGLAVLGGITPELYVGFLSG